MAEPSGRTSLNEAIFPILYKEVIENMLQISEQNSLSLTEPCQKEIVLNFICEKVGQDKEDVPTAILSDLKQTVSTFLSHFTKRYKSPKVSRKIDRILSDKWSASVLKFPETFVSFLSEGPSKIRCTTSSEKLSHQSNSEEKKKIGRKRKSFQDKKVRSQFQESSALRGQHSPRLIHFASQQNLRIEGKKDAAFVVKRVSSETGRTAKFAKAAILARDDPTSKPFLKKTPEEALFFLLTNNLTKEQYTNIKQACRESGADIWPSYSYVQGAKSGLEPEQISVEENEAVVPLQDVLNHTVKRIIHSNPAILQKMEGIAENNDNCLETTLYYKIGFDSSGAHSFSQQTNLEGEHREIKSLMASQMAPIKLVAFIDDEEVSLLDYPGQNNPHSCRPLRLAFEKENSETIQIEYQRLQKEMNQLQNYLISENPKISVSFSGLFTLIDGKVLCSITGAKTTECPICHKSGKELAKNEGPFEVVSTRFLEYGASPLHFGLRAFSTLLQIGYKQDFKQHRVTKEHSAKFEARKLIVKKAFKRELNLIVDSGSDPGKTLSGNVARKAFANPIVFAQIIGVSPVLVSNLDVIWRTMASNYKINGREFEQFCKQTLDIYLSEVCWYNIPPTIHKILVHGRAIVEACPVALGLTSEESSEANNKFIRKFLTHHTRKTSHLDTMTDLFHRLMAVSDPCLLSKSLKDNKKKSKQFTPEMKELLQLPEMDIYASSSDDEENESETD
jgi:hypothetical protein